MRIQPFDPRWANDREIAALNTFRNVMRLERSPDDPPMPLEEEAQRIRNTPAFVVLHAWGVWNDEGSQLIASANLHFEQADHNRHAVEFELEVLPEYRRRGIARMLLRNLVDATVREGRTLMIGLTVSTAPAGEAFMRRIGATMGLPMRISQLDLRDLNRDLIPLWQERARERATGYEILLWTGRTPEEYVDEYLKVVEAMNRAPLGGLQLEDQHWSPEQLRQWEDAERARGGERWTMVAREKATGAFAGFTEVSWHPNRPELLRQAGTGVLERYQNLGLGRWLKAAMLEKVLRERPQVRRVRTGNATVNEPMLKINIELGFKPYKSEYFWQIEVPQVKTYLEGSESPAAAPAG
ncbi:MAG TPA: GNAT family N-acetyltransferase [bacterium]|nr:GNAT family N-acetyltransferase [bacterium]